MVLTLRDAIIQRNLYMLSKLLRLTRLEFTELIECDKYYLITLSQPQLNELIKKVIDLNIINIAWLPLELSNRLEQFGLLTLSIEDKMRIELKSSNSIAYKDLIIKNCYDELYLPNIIHKIKRLNTESKCKIILSNSSISSKIKKKFKKDDTIKMILEYK